MTHMRAHTIYFPFSSFIPFLFTALFILPSSPPCVSPSLHLCPPSLSDNWGKSHRPLAVLVTVPFSIPSVTILAQHNVDTAN